MRDIRQRLSAHRYRLARELQFEFWADQIVEIADASEADPRDRQVRIDVRKWLLSKGNYVLDEAYTIYMVHRPN